jgi:hypothetical protein
VRSVVSLYIHINFCSKEKCEIIYRGEGSFLRQVRAITFGSWSIRYSQNQLFRYQFTAIHVCLLRKALSLVNSTYNM